MERADLERMPRRCFSPSCDADLVGRQKKWHEDRCRIREERRASRADERDEPLLHALLRARYKHLGKKPPNVGFVRAHDADDTDYEWFITSIYPEAYARGLVDELWLADECDRHPDVVFGWIEQWWADILKDRNPVESWRPTGAALKALGDFESFRRRYFRNEQGKAYVTPDFQAEWITSMLAALPKSAGGQADSGGLLQILSPPRHGKSALLRHFAIYLICRNPNIRIMWVGQSREIAQLMVQAVADELASNTKLISEQTNGHGFKPEGRGAGTKWSAGEFVISGRNVTGIASPTMVALGKGGSILSRDCDLIVVDDMIDTNDADSPAEREKLLRWWTSTLMSRKESDTEIVVIGSRQHPDDIYDKLLENPLWDCIVNQAHDPGCTKDEDDFADHVDCMLFPERNDFRWLMVQKQSFALVPGRFEMVYQNNPRGASADYVSEEEFDACRDPARDLGDIPAGCRLIAGLDPASRGFQASFLWAWDPETGIHYMVDSDNTKGGGMPAARRIIEQWFTDYGVTTWVIERNNYQQAILQDRGLQDFCSRHGITLHPTFTSGSNKHDPAFGVTAMLNLFRLGRVSVPDGSPQAQAKVREFKAQVLNFDGTVPAARARHASDLVMAAWFPTIVIHRWDRQKPSGVDVQYKPSFAGFDRTPWNDAPWKANPYLKRAS